MRYIGSDDIPWYFQSNHNLNVTQSPALHPHRQAHRWKFPAVPALSPHIVRKGSGSNEEYEMLGIAGSTYWPASLATYLWHSIVTRQFPSGAHTPQSFHV